MNRSALGVLAVFLIILMVIVGTAGLDNLPRSLHQSIAAAATQLDSSRAALDRDRAFIDRAAKDDPDLFQNQIVGWDNRLDNDKSRLASSALVLADLQKLDKANRRADRDKVERELKDFQSQSQAPVRDADAVKTQAERWIGYKRDLSHRVGTMRASYETVNSFDVDAATSQTRKALTDWPAKRADLQTRLDALKDLQSQGRQLWSNDASLVSSAESKKLTGEQYAKLFGDADRLDGVARDLKDRSAALNTLSSQLYSSWDKVLVDVDRKDGYREKIRTVKTTFPDAALTGGKTNSAEEWRNVDSSQYKVARRQVGMALEHKPAGSYDSEAQRVVQPADYAYVAPPGQSNAYGGWTNGVWHWLPEYLILRELLHANRGPVTIHDYEAWRQARRQGEVYYPRSYEAPRSYDRVPTPSGSTGGWYKERPKPSFGDRGFDGSKYESRGAFNGSRYQSRGSFGSRGAMRSFGRGGRR